jgi:hypothetical protein
VTRALAVLAALAGVTAGVVLPPPAGAQAPTPTPQSAAWRPGLEEAIRYAATRPGSVRISVRTPERAWGARADAVAPCASLLKVMLMAAYLREPEVRATGLDAAQRAALEPMIRRSDDATATRLRARLGPGALPRLAQAAELRRFAEHPVWGLSACTPADQTRLWLGLPELLPVRHRAYALRLAERIVSAQRWGIARVSPQGWRLAFKGGWGAATGAVSHQSALLRRGRERVAVSVMTVGSPSHAASLVTLEGVFRRLLRAL